MLRYGIYTRKSHDDKKLTEKSTGEQVAECYALAQRDDLKIVWECEESKSAKTPRVRAHYAELIRLIEKGKVDGILCWHVNRLVRNMEEGGKLVQLLIDGQVKEIRTPHSVYRSGENILAVVIEAASATQHSIDHTNTVKRSSRGNFQSGGWNHKAPPGYQNVRDPLNSRRGLVKADPERWSLIRRAWDLVLSGEHNVTAVARKLEEWGFRTRECLNTPSGPLGHQGVREMFRNPFYLGFVRESGEMLTGRHPAMVTVSEFQKVQELLDRRSFRANRKKHHAYAGLMKCGYCGQYVTAETKKLRTGPWEVYHCSDSYDRCTQKGLSASRLEEMLLQSLVEMDFDRESLTEGIRSINESLDNRQALLEERAQSRVKAHGDVTQRLQRLTEMWLSGLLTDAARYQEMEQSLLSERERLTMAMSEDESGISSAKRNVAKAELLIEGAKKKMSGAPASVKRSIAQCIGTYTFYGAEKRIDFTPHPCLREVVTVLRQKRTSLEPPKRGSGSQKRAVLNEQLFFGRGEHNGIELPESLLVALTSEDLTLPPCFDLEAAAAGLQGAA